MKAGDPRSQIMDSPQHCHVGWNWLCALWRVWLPRKKFMQFFVFVHSLNLWPCLKEEPAPRLASRRRVAILFFAAARSSGRLGSKTPVWRGRRKATDDRRIVYVSFWISYSDLQSAHPSKVIGDHEWTPAAAAAGQRRLDGPDAPGKRMPFQLSGQEMHRKFFHQNSVTAS